MLTAATTGVRITAARGLLRTFASASAAQATPPPPNAAALSLDAFGIARGSPPVPISQQVASVVPNTQQQDPYIAIPPVDDPLLHYLASKLNADGHRARASRQASRVLLHLHAFTRAPALPILRQAVLAVAPAVRTISTRRGAKAIFRPVALGEKQRIRFAMTWILDASKNQNGQTVEERIAREVIAVLNGQSSALKRKEEAHKLATVNRYVFDYFMHMTKTESWVVEQLLPGDETDEFVSRLCIVSSNNHRRHRTRDHTGILW
jgi:small subunit ribosomal protein S7